MAIGHGAEALAAAAFARTAEKGPDIDDTDRLQMAILLARWGCVDWATTCYTALLDNARTTSAEFALAAILASEFLHEQEREAEAAACLGKLLDNTVGRADLNVDQILQQLGRDQRTVRSRMHFFESCAARARGDIPAARQAVEIALRSYAKDVDALIGLYTLPDNTAVQKIATRPPATPSSRWPRRSTAPATSTPSPTAALRRGISRGRSAGRCSPAARNRTTG